MKNIVVLVADALRYDAVPGRVRDEFRSGVIPTLAPSLHTPTSFASLFTARSPQHHNVRDFLQDLDPDIPTAFDQFDNTAFYDGPDSTLDRHIFRSGGADLDAMEPPFCWIERLMETHIPYGEMGHDREFEWEMPGSEYREKGMRGDFDLQAAYRDGVAKLEDHVFRHIEELDDRGLLDDTLVVLTSDHGELFGERYMFRQRFEHNYPPLRPLVEVPTAFYNADVDTDCMRGIDVLPTAFSIVGKEPFGDGVDVRTRSVSAGANVMNDPKARFRTRWRFRDGHWRPTGRSRVHRAVKTVSGDIKQAVYRRGYRPLEERVEELASEGGEDEIAGVDV
ncbi:MAG: sulfatase-like hydrolase/transferase [Candidatus Nanohaloarchaea archaeon]|nr:sulfatase-like hydrolase/transferase [Candidatus Nanohaloarchaea archaeon]